MHLHATVLRDPNIRLTHVSRDLLSTHIVRSDDDDRYKVLCPLSKGNLRLEINGKVRHDGMVFPGMFCMSAPGTREQVTIRDPFDSTIVQIPNSRLRNMPAWSRLGDSGSGRDCLQPFAQRNHVALNLVRDFRFADCLGSDIRQSFINGVTEALLALLLDHQDHPERFSASHGIRTLTDSEMQRCTEFVDKNIDQKLCLGKWARVLSMPVAEFARRFEAKTRETPYAWLLNRRIERAQWLLGQTPLPLSEVALAAGFGSQSHFTEAFRKRVSVPPARWRSLQMQIK